MKESKSDRMESTASRLRRPDVFLMVLGSVLIGAVSAAGAVLFVESIIFFQKIGFGADLDELGRDRSNFEGWRIFLVLTVGGLVIGLFTRYLMPGGQTQGVAQVIEANAVTGGRMSLRAGIGAAVISALSIGCGGSVGREGPVVHLGATLASFISRHLRYNRAQVRTLLGCGVAAAVAASFNAPIAGVFFALEVVIGHYALTAFAPIVAASVVGTVISRMYFGDLAAFAMPSHPIVSYWEFPAFVLLGLVSAAVAIVFLRSVPLVERCFQAVRVPTWLRPAVAGMLVAGIAIYWPEVLGVGYVATDLALKESYDLPMLIALAAAKVAATAICLGGRFGGGVFSPSLFMGAMVGGAFGLIVAMPLPDMASGEGAYTIVGMGAVAGAVLGAPVSTILIVFELTGDYRITTAVMVAVVTASTVTRYFHGVSFFIDQLKRLGMDLEGAHETGLINMVRVRDVMHADAVTLTIDTPVEEARRRLLRAPGGVVFLVDPERRLLGTIIASDGGAALFENDGAAAQDLTELISGRIPVLTQNDGLAAAVRLFSHSNLFVVPVVDGARSNQLVGMLSEHDAMRAYADGLLSIRAEEHGESTTRSLLP